MSRDRSDKELYGSMSMAGEIRNKWFGRLFDGLGEVG
jgi:hypothetical protein